MPGVPTGFRDYLRVLPDSLLQAVAGDYIWLADFFAGEPTGAVHLECREACWHECRERGQSDLYRKARRAVSPSLDEAA